jgi:acyl-CoA synthetase (NDP forming)
VVALKTGRSAGGAQLTVSHTASLAGGAAVASAFLKRIGVAEVDSIPVLLETLKLLHLGGPLAGRDIASLSCSGGEAALVADAIDNRRLRFRPLSEGEAARVAATLSPLATASNPLDYHTFAWANEPALTETFAAVMAARFAMTMLILDFPRLDRCDDADWLISAEALAAASRRTGARAAVVATLPETMPEERAQELFAMGLTPLLGLDEALAALEAAADAGEAVDEEAPHRPRCLAQGAFRALSEWDGKLLLAGQGLSVPNGRLALSPAEAIAVAEGLGYPVAVKASGPTIAHKSEIGAVRLGLSDAASVAAAAEALLEIGEALLVEQMIEGAVAELIVGVARDPIFGLHLLIGSGGVLAELVADRSVLPMPASRSAIDAAIRSLRVGRILEGFRGKPKGDISACVDAVLAVQSFAAAHADRLFEVDINPLIVRAPGCGAVVADALIRFVEDEDDA